MRTLSTTLVVALFFALSFAQQQDLPLPMPLDTAPEYKLGPGDVLDIGVFGVEQFQYQVQIGSSGTVTLPYMGPVKASGLTVAEFAAQLEQAMDGKLFKNPKVTITIKEYRSQPIVLLGAVNKPGTYQKQTGTLSLLDFMAQAGGVTANAGDQIIIQRRAGNEGGNPEVITLQIKDLFGPAMTALNIPLEGGDIINVPLREEGAASSFYIVGDVGRPGVFAMPKDGAILLSQAVASAGGPLKTAKGDKGVLIRYDEQGQRQELAIDLKKILVGTQPDFEVKPKDVIFIPGSTAKSIGYGLLGIIPGIAGSAATSVIIP